LTVGGIALREDEAGRRWTVELADGRHHLDLRWDAFTGPNAIAAGRTEQTCRVRGTAVINGVSVAVDGVGQRAHTRGGDDPEPAVETHAISGFLGPAGRAVGEPAVARSLQVRHVLDGAGAWAVAGEVHDGGADHRVTGLERTTELDDEGAPARFLAAVATAGGPGFEVRGLGHGAGVAIPAADGRVTRLRLMRLETDDGLDGYGLYEHTPGPTR
jgi:hypothetical protein